MATAVMKTSVSAKLESQLKALTAEKKRLQAIDDAEKQARKEYEEERLRLEKERQRVKREQTAMMEWEAYQPPPPPEVTIARLTEDDPPQAVLSDERFLPIAPEKVQELKDLLESASGMDPPKIVVASQMTDPSVEVSASFGQYVDDFRLADPPAAAEATVDGEGADAGS